MSLYANWVIKKSVDKTSQSMMYVFVLFFALLLSACGGGGGGGDDGAPATPGISVSKTSLSTSEDGTEDSFAVTLKTQPTSDVSLTFTSRDLTEGSIGSDSDVDGYWYYFGETVDLDFTPANWNVPQVIRVEAQVDALIDGNQTYSVANTWVFSMDLNYLGVAKPTVSVTNIDTDAAGVTVSTTSLTTAENGTNSIFFTVKLNIVPSGTVTIPLTISDASEGTFDYYSSGVTEKTLTFEQYNWSNAQSVYIYDVDDVIADGNQTYNITVGPIASTDLNYNGLTGDTVSVTNIDDDTAAFTVSALEPLQTKEGGQTASFTVVLNTEPTADVIIPVTTPDVTEGLVSSPLAALGATLDLTFTSTDWQTPQTVTVNPVDDADQDGDISYNISVGAPAGASEYTTLLTQTVAVVNVDDDTARVNIQGADLQTTEDAGTDTFTVSLAKAPTGDVVINVTSNDTTEGRIKGGSSPTTAVDAITLTFTAADWQTAQTVTVVGQDDFEIDSNQTYTVNVAIDTTSTLDAEYDLLSAQSVSVTNADNDVAGLTVAEYVSATEGGATDFFTVNLNTKPVADVTLPVTVEDQNEFLISGNGTDFASTLNLTFTTANWSTPQTLTVQAVNDYLDEYYVEYFDVTVGPASSADLDYEGLPAVLKSVAIYDNDTAGFVITPGTGLAISENDTSASVTVALMTEPVASVSVTIGSGNTAEGLLTGGDSPATQVDVVTLEFLPGTWQSAQTVSVHGQDDLVLDGPIAFDLTVATITGSDSSYNDLSNRTVSVTNSDNEVGVSETGVVLTLADLPHLGQVAPVSTSTYTISGLAAGWKYTLTAGNVTDDITLEVQESTAPSKALCTSVTTGAKTDESCAFTMPDDGTGAVNIIIDGVGTENGAEFTLSLSTPVLTTTFETYASDWSDMWLYDVDILTDPSEYRLKYDSSFASGGSASVTHDLIAGETYYLKVMPYYTYDIGAYKVQVTQAAASLTDPGIATDAEGEPDNDVTSAAALTVDVPLERYLTDSDIDWFMFTVPMP